jgi:hypothetical protein
MSQDNESGKVIFGVLLVIVIHFLVWSLVFSLVYKIPQGLGTLPYQIMNYFKYGALNIGISQIVYVVPVLIELNRRQQAAVAKGVIIGAILTALLNGGCWLLFSGTIK